MGKLSVEISDEVEQKLRMFIAKNYPLKPFGKLSQIVEEALREWLKKIEKKT